MNTDPRENRAKFRLPLPVTIGCGVILGILTLCACISGSTYYNINKEGVTLETQMTADYKNCQAALTKYYTETQNTLNIAGANSKAIKDIVLAMETGHYGNKSQIQQQNNQLYIDIRTAYPNLGSVSEIYSRAVNVMTGTFDDYTNIGGKLRDEVARYDRWRKANIFTKPFISVMGFPSDSLETDNGGRDQHFSQDAYHDMLRVIMDANSIKSYQNGELQALPTP